MKKEIIDKVNEYLKYISLDHHKGTDGMFRVVKEIDFFSEEECWYAEHEGYINELEIEDYKFFKTQEEAENDIIRIVDIFIKREKDWAKEVLKSQNDYDIEQIEKAKIILEK